MVLVTPAGLEAAEGAACGERAGILISAEGAVEYRNGAEWRPIALGHELCDREAVRTGPSSRAAIQLSDDAVLRLDENTTLVLTDVAPEPEGSSFLQLVFGAIQSFSRDPQTLQVDTPYLNATIEGTEFALRVGLGESRLTVIEGTVLAANELGSVRVASGGGAVAEEGNPPQGVVIVRPRDAVNWALYYPPTLSLTEAETSGVPALAEAARLVRENRPDAAIARLDATPGAPVRVDLYRASVLLSVGRVEEASAIINSVLEAEPENGVALALSAVIDVALNERETALAKAQQAVAAAPDEAALYIALSYAQQAHFRLEQARDTLIAATGRVPNSGLAWARLSEIWLSLGYRGESGEAAERALALDPGLERAHVMRGFAALTEYRTAPAVEAFEQAIALDPADPLPRLGLGLARIREGALEAGRGEIDAAVALDSNRSLLRSYLGKAYFEENRNELAAQQLSIAKDLDPQDPTPYLYDAIRLQTENRPGEAWGAIQKSIERNENRAVYRSRLQLDQDEAARAASLGRIYEDLGFIQLGMCEATRSMARDPANAAAHRFLADIYRSERRREIARVSELLRSQLLQDVNLNPIQPSLTETNLNLVALGGPANPGFNEYNSLFASDGFRFTATGVVGNQKTFGGEAAVALQDDNISISFGGLEFTSDGFRENFDVRHTIYDLFAQWAVTPEFNLQAELRHRESRLGDLDINFDPDIVRPAFDLDFQETSARIGVRFSPDPNNDTLASFIYTQSEVQEFDEFVPGFASGTFLGDGEGWQGELQHIYRRDWMSLTVGASHAGFDDFQQFLFDFVFLPFPIIIEGPVDFTETRVYGYGTADLPLPEALGELTLTLGASYSWYEEENDSAGFLIDVDGFSPKVGLTWEPIDDLLFRAAYFQVIKPPLVTNRTIEPTQVAGFNQFYDDFNGTDSTLYGLGVDYKVTDRVFVGAESIWRDLDITGFDGIDIYATDWHERTHRAYVNLLPHERVPVSIEFVHDRFEADSSVLTTGAITPTEVTTFSVPVSVRYFDPSGFFAGITGTFVHKDVDRENPAFAEGKSDFFNLDAAVGYRFPNQRGSVSLQFRNILNNDYDYQDEGFREISNSGATGPFFPEFSVLGRLTINF